MKSKYKKINILIIFTICFFCFAKFALASTNLKEEVQGTAGTSGIFQVDIKIDSDESINTISGVLNIPQDFSFVKASDGNQTRWGHYHAT